MAFVDRKGRPHNSSVKGWPEGTESFGVEPIASHRHPTVHNLSPVEGDDTAEDHFRKSKWHYDRAGVVTKSGEMAKKRPGKFANAVVHDYKGQLKAHDE